MKHTLVISDVHLCEAVHSDGPWMRWRQRPYFPDAEFVGLVDHLLVRLPPGERAELVFNGDLFDFDAGRVIDGRAVFEDLPRTEPVARELIERILDDHPGYVDAVGRFLAAGHHVVFVSGNHDPQLGFDRVRRFIRERLALAAGHPRFADAVHFRAWFHHTAEGIHIEHGNQFDPYCSFRYPMLPLLPPERGRDRVIAPTVGSITFRLLGSRLGTMNPHFDDSWGHVLRGLPPPLVEALPPHRALPRVDLPRREFFVSWPRLSRGRDAALPTASTATSRPPRAETRCDPERVAEHARLFAPPADEALHKVIREFYVDRVVLGALSAGAIVAPLVARSRRTRLHRARRHLPDVGLRARVALPGPRRQLPPHRRAGP
jgi:UDP-2,3-diacylglucosamine pyrophosphatase LpxH